MQQQLRLSSDELPGVIKELVQEMEGWRKHSEAGRPEASEQPLRVQFSANGRLLFCTTAKGLRIFDWEALLASEEESPAPRLRLDVETDAPDPLAALAEGPAGWKRLERLRRTRSILALAEDPRRNLLLFGTGGGKIGALDLETGSERTLLEIPGEMEVDGMGLSTDGTALYTSLRPDTIWTLERKPPKPAQFLVWDYTQIAG